MSVGKIIYQIVKALVILTLTLCFVGWLTKMSGRNAR